MELLIDHVAGLDVHKKSVTACVRTPGPTVSERREVKRTFLTFHDSLVELRDWIVAEGVTEVVMEATGVFWKPVWFALEGHVGLRLVNARHVKMVPGRKTDVGDAAWLAQLLEVGLLRASFVPPPDIRDLRDLTRYRKRLHQDEVREGQRVEKVLEDAGIKLSSVASKTLGVSGRLMLEALIAGERDPHVLAELAKGKLRAKAWDLARALATGRFTSHHAAMLRAHLDHVDHLAATTRALDDRIAELCAPYRRAHAHLVTMPGIGDTTAEVILAEVGADMSVFPTAGHLASWAGLCPGNDESAGKRRSGRTNPGSVWLTDALLQSAWSVSRMKGTYLSAKFWRLARRIGKKRAAVAVAHTMIIAVWHMLNDDVDYHDLGDDWIERRRDPDRETRRLVQRLHDLGHDVTITAA